MPPTGPSELSYLSVDTRTPRVGDYFGEDGGKTAHYMLRWVATTGEKSPWSEIASATIGRVIELWALPGLRNYAFLMQSTE